MNNQIAFLRECLHQLGGTLTDPDGTAEYVDPEDAVLSVKDAGNEVLGGGSENDKDMAFSLLFHSESPPDILNFIEGSLEPTISKEFQKARQLALEMVAEFTVGNGKRVRLSFDEGRPRWRYLWIHFYSCV